MNRIWTTFRYTFSRLRWQIIGWGIGIAALGLILVPFYDIFMDPQADFMEMLESYPEEFMAFFGGDVASLLTPEGYLGMYGFSLLPLIIGFFAVMAGSGLFASDEEGGRLDLIIAHPVGRPTFFIGRVLAFLAATATIMLIGWFGFSILLGQSTLGLSWAQMARPFLPLFAQAVVYGILALMLSFLLPTRNLAAMLAGLVMVVGYVLSSLGSLNESLATVAKLFPYEYFQGTDAISDLNLVWFFGLLGVSAGMALLAGWLFQRRNIRLGGEGSFRLPSFALPRRA